MTSLRIGLVVFALSTVTSAHAASFDCSKARSLPERMVCGDVRLSAIDERLATTYASALQVTSSPDRLRAEQRQWVAERDRCVDAQCLTGAYTRRIAVLNAGNASPAPGQTQAAASCRQSVGAARAAILVKQCIQVSPASHPPCNDANACAMITDEITRGCGMLTSDVPSFCRQYPGPR